MNSLDAGDNICRFFLKGHCSKGNNCQFRHVRTDPSKAVVCKHWLRGLCKKGDNCEFLHEYNLRKMPECWFYSKYGECNNGTECIVCHLRKEQLKPGTLFFAGRVTNLALLLIFLSQSCSTFTSTPRARSKIARGTQEDSANMDPIADTSTLGR